MYCWQCGTENDDNNYRCVKCGVKLRPDEAPPSPSPPQRPTNDPVEVFIPYRNGSALIAYYLGVFSVIPLFGMFLGVAGFIFGLRGLRFAADHPESRGKVHAWVGILAGGFFALLSMVLLLLFLVNTLSENYH